MKKISMVLALVAATSVAAFASDTCTGGGNNVTVYSVASLDNGVTLSGSSDSCTMEGYTFSNFEVYAGTGFPDTGGLPFSLTVSVDAGGVEGELGLSYNGLAANEDIELAFQIQPGVTLLTLYDGSATSVSENVCSSLMQPFPNSTCNGTNLNLSLLQTNSPSGPNSATSIITSAADDVVVKDINGGSEVFQLIGIPEPMTMSLMGIGLLGLGLLGRRVRK